MIIETQEFWIDKIKASLRCDASTGRLYWLERSDVSHPVNARFAGKEAFTATCGPRGERGGMLSGKRMLSHTVVWALTHGCMPNGEIDHINGDPSDNRPCNLRVCTSSQNKMNRGKQVNNTSGFKGVSWHSKAAKWQCHIMVARKSIYLGLFACAHDAHKAYCEASEKYHGSFARTA